MHSEKREASLNRSFVLDQRPFRHSVSHVGQEVVKSTCYFT